MNGKQIIIISAISGVLAVGLGAFGAHGLEALLLENGRIATYETAVQYHMFHTLLLLALGILRLTYPEFSILKISAWCCIAGILIFSGSLYVLSLTNITILGAITPIGGIFFLLSWALLAFGARKFL